MSKSKLRDIPVLNYVYMCLIVLGSVFVLYYFYLMYNAYSDDILSTGVMGDYLSVINFNEIDDYVTENKDVVIYVSVLGDEEIVKFERSFKNVVVDNNLRGEILYLDVTFEDMVLVCDKFEIGEDLPYLVVYTDGIVTGRYSISDNGYSSKKILNYLNRIGVIDED